MQRRENVNTPQNEETADDDNEERDILESELDENDPLKNCIGELNGETLLEMCYSISASVPEDITIDTTLKKIFTLNSMNFYNDQQNNHLYTGRPSHPMLRHNAEIERNILPEESCIKRTALTIKQVLDLSNSSLKGQEIIVNGRNPLPTDKVQSVARSFITEYPFVMKCKSQDYGKRDKNLALLKNTVWPLNATDRKNCNSYQIENPLKLCESEVKRDIGKSRDEEFREMNSEGVSSKAVQAFGQNVSRQIAPSNTIYLCESLSSKDSSETVVTSSMTLASGRENSQATEVEKFSSIASL